MSTTGTVAPEVKSGGGRAPVTAAEAAGHLALAATYVMLFVAQWNQPYTIDEAAFPYAAAGILDSGVPEFYNGDTRPADMGLWHPPAYVYALAGHMALFGESPAAVRSFGLACILVTAIVGQFALKRGFPQAGRWARLTLTATLLLNPLVISGSLVPDIDGTLGILLMMLGVLAVVYVLDPSTRVHWIFLATTAMWFAACWTKLTLAILLVPIIGFAALLKRDRRFVTLVASAAGAAVGALLTLVTWRIASALLDADFAGPFSYFVSGRARSAGRGPVLDAVWNTLNTDPALFWLGPLLLLALLIGVAVLWPKLRLVGLERLAVALLGTTAMIVVVYAAITSSVFQFPKYWGAAIPVASVLLGLLVGVAADLPVWQRRTLGVVPGALLVVATAGLVVLGILWAWIAIDSTVIDGWRSQRVLLISGLVLSALCGLALASLAWPAARPVVSVSYVLVVSLAMGVAIQQLLVSVSIARADFSTRYYYGERGLSEVVAAVEAQTGSEDVILAAKDVGLQSHRRFDEDAGPLYALTPEQFDSYLAERGLALVVTRKKYDYSEAVFPEHFRVLPRYFTPAVDQPSPDFTIWVPREDDGSGQVNSAP